MLFEPAPLPTEFTSDELGWFDTEPVVGRVLAAIDAWAAPAPVPLPLESPADILADAGDDYMPVIPDLAFRTLKTLLVGRPKGGKSFLLWAKAAEAVRAGLRVLYLTEEPRQTVADKLRVFGLEDADGFRIVRRTRLPDGRWKTIAGYITETVKARHFDLVIVDTARAWFNLAGDESNSADVIGPALDALSAVCDLGAAAVVVHQAPWDSKRARNSTEFHAAVDLIFHVAGEGSEPRTIKYVGGRVDSVPDERTFRWSDGVAEDLGKMRHSKATRVDEVLHAIDKAEEPLTAEEIADKTDYNVRSIQRWLKELERDDKVVRESGKHFLQGQEPDRWRRSGGFLKLLSEAR